MTKIKICGLSRECDVDFVNEAKPDYAGFVVNFPKSRRNVSPDRARELALRLSPEITPVGVFVDERPEVIAELVNCGAIRAAQLHGSEDDGYIKNLRSLCRCEIIQAFRVKDENDVRRAAQSSADCVLLDGGQGEGRRFDWKFAEKFPSPLLHSGRPRRG